jgi:hypothetical protein
MKTRYQAHRMRLPVTSNGMPKARSSSQISSIEVLLFDALSRVTVET